MRSLQLGLCLLLFLLPLSSDGGTQSEADPASFVDPYIGTSNGGNVFPGAVVPFGMVAWSPEEPPLKVGDGRVAAPGGYEYRATKIRGFSLTHLSGTGCLGASGDVPFMPYVGVVTVSPSVDDQLYSSSFLHDKETASPGFYAVQLENGVSVELGATLRSGSGRFIFPQGQAATMLVRTSDSEVGSSDAHTEVDPATRTIRGWVTSGNFCNTHSSYYTLHFVAHFDTAFVTIGAWHDGTLSPTSTASNGGTTYGERGIPVSGRGSGAYVTLDTSKSPVVSVRVGISYVSIKNAEENLLAENPEGTRIESIRTQSRRAWDDRLGQISVGGGTSDQLTIFYTALYHSLLHPNVYSDINGQYWGMDHKVHKTSGIQKLQYANFSGWDVYRSQLQLVTLLDPKVGSDIAQSLLNQAQQNSGEWDRWTHNSGATHIMNGDPSAPAIADILAFGGAAFDVRAAYASLLKAATIPTLHDLSDETCPFCAGQRPSLDEYLKIHYLAVGANAWDPAADTLEDATADFAISELARRLGDVKNYRLFLTRAQYWKNLFNPNGTREAGYIQDRNSDGSWVNLDPGDDDAFVEGSAAQYLWMVPFNERGLFDLLGGNEEGSARLDAFFHKSDGSWALTNSGGLHAELNNEPSIETPWLYDFSGQPYKTQETVRQVINTLWTNDPGGIPGNDDLGEMSSWYVWSALGVYPGIPGRAELLISSPLFPAAHIHRSLGDIVIKAPSASEHAFYIQGMALNGNRMEKPWLRESVVRMGGTIEYVLTNLLNQGWGSASADAPPSFSPEADIVERRQH